MPYVYCYVKLGEGHAIFSSKIFPDKGMARTEVRCSLQSSEEGDDFAYTLIKLTVEPAAYLAWRHGPKYAHLTKSPYEEFIADQQAFLSKNAAPVFGAALAASKLSPLVSRSAIPVATPDYAYVLITMPVVEDPQSAEFSAMVEQNFLDEQVDKFIHLNQASHSQQLALDKIDTLGMPDRSKASQFVIQVTIFENAITIGKFSGKFFDKSVGKMFSIDITPSRRLKISLEKQQMETLLTTIKEGREADKKGAVDNKARAVAGLGMSS